MDGSPVFGLIGILKIISSGNLMRRVFFGFTAIMSFTIIQKKNGPKAWGTPLLTLINSVLKPSTTTLCLRLFKIYNVRVDLIDLQLVAHDLM